MIRTDTNYVVAISQRFCSVYVINIKNWYWNDCKFFHNLQNVYSSFADIQQWPIITNPHPQNINSENTSKESSYRQGTSKSEQYSICLTNNL